MEVTHRPHPSIMSPESQGRAEQGTETYKVCLTQADGLLESQFYQAGCCVAVPPPRRSDTALTQGICFSSCPCHRLPWGTKLFGVCVSVIAEGALSCMGGDQGGSLLVSRVRPMSQGLSHTSDAPTLSSSQPLLALGTSCAVGPARALTCWDETLCERNASGFHSGFKTVLREALRGARTLER